MESTKQCFELQKMGDVVIATPTNRRIIEDIWIREAGTELFRLVDEEGCSKIILDFTTTEYMSSAFFGKLIALHEKTKKRRGKLVLCNVCPEVYAVFAITRLDRLICIVPSVEDGIRTLNGIL